MLPPHVFAIGECTTLLLVMNDNSLNIINMLFVSWEVHILKNCDRGLENAVAEGSIFQSKVTVFHYTD